MEKIDGVSGAIFGVKDPFYGVFASLANPKNLPGRPPAEPVRRLADAMGRFTVSPPSETYSLRSSFRSSSSTRRPRPPTLAPPSANWVRDLNRKEAQAQYEMELQGVARAHVVQLHREQVALRQQAYRERQQQRQDQDPP